VTLPAPGGDAELQELIASQRTLPLDRGEPLWQDVLVDGFHGGSAVLFRTHHAIADGIRMVQVTLSVLDTSPDGSAPARRTPPRPRRAPAPPSSTSVTGRAVAQATTVAHGSLRLARSAVVNPVGGAHSALALAEWMAGAVGTRARSALGDVDTFRKLVLGTRNDQTSWTGKVGQHKAIAWSPPIPLDEVRAVARTHAATVNDVLVTCVAESLRDYLDQHGDVCHSVTWDVPVNMLPFDPSLPVALGNGFALVQLELPTNIDDPVRTLEVVRRRMGRIKRGHEALIDFGIQAVLPRMSRRLYRASVDLLANRAIGVLTNVPGPQVPLYIAGRKVEGMMGWAPLTAEQIMSFTIYSYDGKVFVGIAADAELVPDHEQIVDGFAHAFRRLAGRVGSLPGSSGG
jgi:diacylglycerol O-acyltransferase